MIPEQVIPYGMYCYQSISCKNAESFTLNGLCPFWSIDKTKPSQNNGYCHHLKQGDWEVDGLSLIWDQVKECDVNYEFKCEDICHD